MFGKENNCEYCIPADLVVDNRSDLVKVVAAPVVGQRTYRDACVPIYLSPGVYR